MRLAASTGSRRGELLGLRWSDVDTVAATMQRRRIVVQTDRSQVHVRATSKTGQRLPRITIDAASMVAIRRLQTVQVELALSAGVDIDPDPWLFQKADAFDASTAMPPSVGRR